MRKSNARKNIRNTIDKSVLRAQEGPILHGKVHDALWRDAYRDLRRPVRDAVTGAVRIPVLLLFRVFPRIPPAHGTP